jgi:hypothetical protein
LLRLLLARALYALLDCLLELSTTNGSLLLWAHLSAAATAAAKQSTQAASTTTTTKKWYLTLSTSLGLLNWRIPVWRLATRISKTAIKLCLYAVIALH